MCPGNLAYYILCFFVSVHKLAEMDQFTFRVLRPECLGFTGGIVGNHFIGCTQDVLGGTVILFQTDDLCIRENMLESEDVSDVCTTEFVDRLVIITHNTEIFILGSQQAYEFELCCVGVLILVYHDVFETFLIVLKNISAVLEQFYCLYDQIVEIQRVILSQRCLILTVYCCHFLLIKVTACIQFHFIWCDQLVFCMGNLCKQGAFLVDLGIDIQLSADFFHQSFLVFCIVDGKSGIESQTVNVSAQDPHAGRVEGGYPDAL